MLTYVKCYTYSSKLCIYLVAKDLVKKLLTVDPLERLTIEEALEHPWMKVKQQHFKQIIIKMATRLSDYCHLIIIIIIAIHDYSHHHDY